MVQPEAPTKLHIGLQSCAFHCPMYPFTFDTTNTQYTKMLIARNPSSNIQNMCITTSQKHWFFPVQVSNESLSLMRIRSSSQHDSRYRKCAQMMRRKRSQLEAARCFCTVLSILTTVFFWPSMDVDKNCKVLWIYILQKIEYVNSYSTLCYFQFDFTKSPN